MDRRDFIKVLASSAAGLVIAPRTALGQSDGPWEIVYPQILARIRPPRFPRRSFNILKYGAVAGGTRDNREAINRAITACSKAGGGRVIIPAGVFLTGAIRLRSNVNLHISKGATLKFSTDPKAYLPIVHTRESHDCERLSPMTK